MSALEQMNDQYPQFVEAITEAQVRANLGWRPDGKDIVDKRIVECPNCGAPGMNTCWGYWAFTCCAEVLVDDEGYVEGCGAPGSQYLKPSDGGA